MTRAAIYARMSTDKQNERSPADQVPLDARRQAFAAALGHLVAELVWRDLTTKPGTEDTKR